VFYASSVVVDRGAVIRRFHEALAYYHNEVLATLVELLHLKYCPGKRGFGLKHVHADLPESVTRRLEGLYGYTQLEDIAHGVELAAWWWDEIVSESV
jgi:hypothetical protein